MFILFKIFFVITRLKCPTQSIWSYIEHNSRLYQHGIDMIYIIQAYFAPRHFDSGIYIRLINIIANCLYLEKWLTIYSKYMDHPIVYGQCALHPLFSDNYNLQMELNIRRAINHQRVVAIGDIGLDFSRYDKIH